MRGLLWFGSVVVSASVACTSGSDDGPTAGGERQTSTESRDASRGEDHSSGSGGPSVDSSSVVPRPSKPLPPVSPDALTPACDERARVGSWPAQALDEEPGIPEPEHDLSAGLFDPESVYVLATPTAGLCDGGVGWVFDPSKLAFGSDCQMQIRINPVSRRLVYLDGVPPRFLHEMGGTETNSYEDDVEIPLPSECEEGVQDFLVAPDGSVFVMCDQTWLRSDGFQIYAGMDGHSSPPRLGTDTVVHVGCRGYALLGNGILEMHSGQVTPLSGVLAVDIEKGVNLLATRAAADGFWTVLKRDHEGRTALWHLSFAGEATYVAAYEQQGYTNDYLFALGGDGALYSTVWLGSTVERRAPDGESFTLLIREGDGLMVEIHSAPPITGP